MCRKVLLDLKVAANGATVVGSGAPALGSGGGDVAEVEGCLLHDAGSLYAEGKTSQLHFMLNYGHGHAVPFTGWIHQGEVWGVHSHRGRVFRMCHQESHASRALE